MTAESSHTSYAESQRMEIQLASSSRLEIHAVEMHAPSALLLSILGCSSTSHPWQYLKFNGVHLYSQLILMPDVQGLPDRLVLACSLAQLVILDLFLFESGDLGSCSLRILTAAA